MILTEMEAEANRAAVARLMTILNGDTPIRAGSDIIAPDVVSHVDGWTFHGIEAWAHWIDYIRTRSRVRAPELWVDEMVVQTDTRLSVRGRWHGVRDGCLTISKPGQASYRLEQGRIVEIWSTRSNYAFLCGSHVETQAGFAFELLRSEWWRRRMPLELLDASRSCSVPNESSLRPGRDRIDGGRDRSRRRSRPAQS